jgi:hypothetical protein
MRHSRWLSHLGPRAIGFSLIAVLLVDGVLSAQTPECPGYPADEGIIWGLVSSSEGGIAVPGVNIIVSWAGGGDTRAQSLANGLYIVCGVRPDVPLTIDVGFEAGSGERFRATVGVGEILQLPLHLALGSGRRTVATGRVVGRVVDRQTLEPIANAMVGADDQYTSVTDGEGRFRLDAVEAGPRTISVRHLAYGETESGFEMPWEGTPDIEIRLDPAVLAVEPIEVEIVGVRSHKLENAGFYERKMWSDRLGLGDYLTRAEIELRGAAQVSHVLSEIPRVNFQRRGCFGSRCDFPLISGSSANCGDMKQEGFEYMIGASIYLDGVRMRMATGGVVMGIDDLVKPSDVAGIEVYTGSGDLPGEFSDFNAQRCGAVVIWTGR